MMLTGTSAGRLRRPVAGHGPGAVRLVLPCLSDRSLQVHAAEVLDMPFNAVVAHWAAVIRADVKLYGRAARILSLPAVHGPTTARPPLPLAEGAARRVGALSAPCRALQHSV